MKKEESLALAHRIFFIYSIIFIISTWFFVYVIVNSFVKKDNLSIFFEHSKVCPICGDYKIIENKNKIFCVEGHKILQNSQ